MHAGNRRDIHSANGAKFRPHSKLLFATLIFSVLFLAACGGGGDTAPGGGNSALADLIISIVSVSPDAFGGADVIYTITNNGAGATDGTDFDVDFFPNPGFVPVAGVDLSAAFFTLVSVVIAAGNQQNFTSNFDLSGFTSGTAYMIVDSVLDIAESNEGNNVSAGFPWPAVAGQPDLTVVIDSINDLGNNTADVTFTVTNGGAAATDGTEFFVDFFPNPLGAPVLGDTSPAFDSILPIIAAAGGTFAVTVNFSLIGETAGTAYLIVDSFNNLIAESDETNNVSAGFAWPAVAGQPDLTVVINLVTPDAFGDAVVNYTITNSGTAATDGTGFFVDFFANPAVPPVLGDLDQFIIISPIIVAGGTLTANVLISLDGFTSGTAYAIADSSGDFIAESNEGNNVSPGFAWIGGAAGQPDLTIAINSVAPVGGGFADVTYTITNGGTGATDGTFFWVDFFPNASPAPALGDLGPAFDFISPVITAGGTFQTTINLSLDFNTFGTAYVIVDSLGNSIAESNEGNNVSSPGFVWP